METLSRQKKTLIVRLDSSMIFWIFSKINKKLCYLIISEEFYIFVLCFKPLLR